MLRDAVREGWQNVESAPPQSTDRWNRVASVCKKPTSGWQRSPKWHDMDRLRKRGADEGDDLMPVDFSTE